MGDPVASPEGQADVQREDRYRIRGTWCGSGGICALSPVVPPGRGAGIPPFQRLPCRATPMRRVRNTVGRFASSCPQDDGISPVVQRGDARRCRRSTRGLSPHQGELIQVARHHNCPARRNSEHRKRVGPGTGRIGDRPPPDVHRAVSGIEELDPLRLACRWGVHDLVDDHGPAGYRTGKEGVATYPQATSRANDHALIGHHGSRPRGEITGNTATTGVCKGGRAPCFDRIAMSQDRAKRQRAARHNQSGIAHGMPMHGRLPPHCRCRGPSFTYYTRG